MKYFLHDTSAFDDEKISELFINFGYEGLGLFYTALEKIGKQEKPIKTDVLKSQLRIGKRLLKCWSFIEQIGLISSTNGESFNEQLLNFSEKYQIKKEKTREKVSEWRKKQTVIENVTDYKTVSNHSKVKESKVNKSKEEELIKEIEILPDFKDTFINWLRFKKLRGESYKDKNSAQLAYNKLLKLSENSSIKAVQIVEESMANNWAGLFPLKQDYKQKNEHPAVLHQSDEPVKNF